MDTGKLVKVEMLPMEGTVREEQVMDLLRRFCQNPNLLEQLLRCVQRVDHIERSVSSVEDRCRSTVSRCESLEMLCRDVLCPGNVNFSRLTLDGYSGRSQVKLNEVSTGFGGDFVNAFPVPPGKKIRLTHRPRPGYTPTQIRIDLNIAGGGNNYSDFTVQFYLVPGGTNSVLGLEVGDEHDCNLFLNKDGTQIAVPFMEYRGMPIDVGSLETLAVVITNNSAAANLDSAHVNIFYDNTRFYELCKARCAGGCATPT